MCYASSETIGIKGNVEIKVWVNSNWADNSYRPSNSQKDTIEAIWNVIKLQGSFQNFEQINSIFYKLPQIDFDSVIQMLREKFQK